MSVLNHPVYRAGAAGYRALMWVENRLQSVVLLCIRLYWGWQFFGTGLGKLKHIDKTAEFFASLNIPAPKANVIMAGGTEMIGGLLLLVGLGSRVITLPLIFTMIIAYVTADREAVEKMFSDPDKFVSAAPFLFLMACVIVAVFGPGRFSLDYLIAWLLRKKEGEVRMGPNVVIGGREV